MQPCIVILSIVSKVVALIWEGACLYEKLWIIPPWKHAREI
jgi:hypothetical protein